MDIDAICPLVSVWRAYSTFITKALIFILMVSKYEAIKLMQRVLFKHTGFVN